MNETLLRDILLGGAGVLVLIMIARSQFGGRSVPVGIQVQALIGFMLVLVARTVEFLAPPQDLMGVIAVEVIGYFLGFFVLSVGLIRWIQTSHVHGSNAPPVVLGAEPPPPPVQAESVKAGNSSKYPAADLLASLLQSSLTGVMLLEPLRDDTDEVEDFTVCRLNQAGEQILGRSASHLVGKRLFREFPCLRTHDLLGPMANVLHTGLPYQDERKMTPRGNTTAWYEFVGVKSAGGLLVNFADISAQKRAEAQLKHAAQHDALTALPNRAFFVERVQLALSRARRYQNERFAVLFLDFDRFKIINDSLGHEAGDQLLVNIAERLRANLRSVDTSSRASESQMPARLGGDEFVVLLERINDVHDAVAVAERLMQALAVPYDLGGHEIVSTASIGIVVSRPEYVSADDVLRDADAAMYRAKMAGKARYVVFDEAMHEDAVKRARMESELRHALATNAFQVVYAPIVSLADGEITGFEALVRWEHPERGLVPAQEFVPLAEELGVMAGIGEWVFREACQHWREWQPLLHGRDGMAININLSKQQLQHPDFLGMVDRVLAQTGVVGDQIRFDITECMLVGQRHGFHREFEALRTRGINLVLDDFGTGQSSFNTLHTVPIDMVKIDRTFIEGMAEDEQKAAIVRAILELANTVGLGTVAEGVETAEQAALLKAMGCDYAQGHHYWHPACAEEVETHLREDGSFEQAA